MKKILYTILCVIGFGIVTLAGIAFATIRTPVPVDSNTPTKYTLELPTNVSGSITQASGTNSFASTTFAGNVTGTAATYSGAVNMSSTLTVTATTTIQGSLVDTNGNKYSTSTGGGSITTSSAPTTNTLPLWTSASALGNSIYSQSSTIAYVNASTTVLGGQSTTSTNSLVWLSSGAGVGYWDATGTIPTISSCGTSPTSTGNQWIGRVTVGSTATACTLTFPAAFVNKPSCIVVEEAVSLMNAMSYAVTTSTLVVSQTALGGLVWNYSCVGQSE